MGIQNGSVRPLCSDWWPLLGAVLGIAAEAAALWAMVFGR